MARTVDPELRRTQLTEVTAELISQIGLDAVTLRNVARRAGWTTGAVTHYFVDKRDLLLATFRSRADLARRRVETSVANGATLLDALIDAALPLDDERLEWWRVWLAFWGAAIGDAELTAEQHDRQLSFCSTVERGLQAEREAGRLRAGTDVAFESRQLTAVLDGIAVQAVFDPATWTPHAQLAVVRAQIAPLRVPALS
jgi:AcrR family transcriptional regulator